MLGMWSESDGDSDSEEIPPLAAHNQDDDTSSEEGTIKITFDTSPVVAENGGVDIL